MTTFADIFKKSFLEEAGDLTIEKFVLSMLVAFICGMIVFAVYRNFYRGVIYNNNFNILLVMTSLITCFMVIVIRYGRSIVDCKISHGSKGPVGRRVPFLDGSSRCDQRSKSVHNIPVGNSIYCGYFYHISKMQGWETAISSSYQIFR